MIRLLATLAVLLIAARPAAALDPQDFAWDMHRGGSVPLDAPLRDEAGATVTLAQASAGLPVILDLDYYHCPSLCGVARGDLIAALKSSGLVGGRDYALVSLSIDPAETAQDAATAKAADLAQAPFTDGRAWHYLTGPAPAIAAIAQAVGFRSRYDDQLKQYLHPAGITVLSRTGTVAGYLLGVGYNGEDLRAAVLQAGQGELARVAQPILLLCFHFDASTGRYTLEIEKVLKLGAALTILTIAGLLLVLHHKRPRAPQ